ncbi:MAG TPA: hypothetical protein VIX90_03645 [Edaphobacter sp.]
MSDIRFAQPARRNLLAPVLIAFVVLGIVLALVLRYTPHRTADLTITKTAVYPAHTVFKSDSILVGKEQAQDDLYVIVNLRVDDRLNLPIFLKDFTATLTTSDGEELHANATEQQDFEAVYGAFPALTKFSSSPLLRETLIAPGKSAEGMVLLHFPVTAEVWDRRKSAVLNVNLYHQGPISITIPDAGGHSVEGPSSEQQ